MKRFKVALFTGNYNHIKDGVSLTLNRLVEFLLENDTEVMVFGPSVSNPDVRHNGTLIAVPSVKMPGRPEYRFTTGFPKDAQKQLEAFDPDLIHLATPDVLGLKALKWAGRKNKTAVASYHTHFTSYLKYYKLTLFEPLLWKYLRWFYGNCRQIYVPTPSMAEELKKQGISGDMKIWARGIDNTRFNPEKRSESWRKSHGMAENDIVISFVSRLVWEKNLKLFADVIRQLQKKFPRVRALVVGDGPAAAGLKELLPKAVYTGFLEGDELATAYASSDIFFFPSDTETFGNVTLEAMASGLPCVVADAVGSKSLVAHGKNGFLAPAGQKKTFIGYIGQLAENEDLRREMSAESLTRAKKFSWSRINSTLLEYYREALG